MKVEQLHILVLFATKPTDIYSLVFKNGLRKLKELKEVYDRGEWIIEDWKYEKIKWIVDKYAS